MALTEEHTATPMIDRNDYEPKPKSNKRDSPESTKRGNVVTSSLAVIRSTTTARYRVRYSNFIGYEVRLYETEEWKLQYTIPMLVKEL